MVIGQMVNAEVGLNQAHRIEGGCSVQKYKAQEKNYTD